MTETTAILINYLTTPHTYNPIQRQCDHIASEMSKLYLMFTTPTFTMNECGEITNRGYMWMDKNAEELYNQYGELLREHQERVLETELKMLDTDAKIVYNDR